MERAFRYVEEHFDDMVAELSALCETRSIAQDRAAIEKTQERLCGKLAALDFDHEVIAVPSAGSVIAAQSLVPDKPTALLYNHFDVVPEGDPGDWATPPFAPEMRGGRLYGRGVSDNKGALIARLHAIEAILAADGKLPAGVRLILDGSEEIGSPGMSAIAANMPDKFRSMTDADVCIWENGYVSNGGAPKAAFGVRSSCIIDLSVRTSNSDEHARTGAEIPNAAWRLAWALSSLKGPDERVLVDGFYDDVLNATVDDLLALEDLPLDEEGYLKRKGIASFINGLTGLELKKKIYLEPSITISSISAGNYGGVKRNIVPCTASARMSILMVPNMTAGKVTDAIRRHLDSHGFEDVEMHTLAEGRPVRTPVTSPFRSVLSAAAERVYDRPMIPTITQLGSGPAYILRDARPDIPVICSLGVADDSSAHHSPNESILMENYRKGILFTIAFLYGLGEYKRD